MFGGIIGVTGGEKVGKIGRSFDVGEDGSYPGVVGVDRCGGGIVVIVFGIGLRYLKI